jgi:Methyltransferase domain
MVDHTVSRFRKARGRLLNVQIDRLAAHLGRDIKIMDVGGRPDYWQNVGLRNVAHIEILNYGEYGKAELERQMPAEIFTATLGDARNLVGYADKSIDLIHANSVIEHVGLWRDMVAMAREVLRVGSAGWIQTPAWEFPIEPHFRAPFLHWFGQPLRRRMMWLSAHYRHEDLTMRRFHVDRINLLSRAEFEALFPDCVIMVERVLFPKSFTARWMPDGIDL